MTASDVLSSSSVKNAKSASSPDAIHVRSSTKHGPDRYGGNYKIQVLSFLPDSWIPYIQLARLFPPAGLFLIYFPHAFGVLHAAIQIQASPGIVLQASTVTFGGSFFFSNAAHVWNDLIDTELDAKVERTSQRPIPRGAVSPRAAFVFTLTQAVGAAYFLTWLPGGFLQGFLYALPNIIATVYYPWAKRHSHFPQLVLGVCLAWGTIMGELALGVPAFTVSVGDTWWPSTFLSCARGDLDFSLISITVDSSVITLFLAGVVWTVIYDTVYAHLDLQADLQVGIKSLAVLFQTRTKAALWPLLVAMASLLVDCGCRSQLGAPYYLIGVTGAIGSLGTMIALVDLGNSQSCWWWFSKGFWLAGGAIVAGLLGEYMLQSFCLVFNLHDG